MNSTALPLIQDPLIPSTVHNNNLKKKKKKLHYFRPSALQREIIVQFVL